ncbi:hypothetical protein Bra3105_18365 (plasmid) [Brachybacterium halotolerans subsp. kimchii]|uniref:hypothetical protein n=1 Tax=Brachybacterium halotolerans TaxID=2795215 RepID=UPI001E4817C0|nr:hypothetical protein [Brachybacterium halotolerans]UEJ84630.1 hypothetical protein Bra3105_18365 [Brachybacterium halotolerans subsp. kimchii]
MATTPTPEEAVERARRSQDQRIETVRALAETRQALTDQRDTADRERADLEARLKDQLREHEAADVKAYGAATSAGWTPEELRKIGFPEPEKKRRARRRTNTSTRGSSNTQHGDRGAPSVGTDTPGS